ncbi:hypothetical protein E2C01_003935 [Portunus trituberculatus]|uniref:Uncharacterized protein n=1 Tax=Portunus trituberculatus TaxID=210409 RepID=A0A5B7CV06_PORTR|nr:hypothetical protein [Portunus trituberculatus]
MFLERNGGDQHPHRRLRLHLLHRHHLPCPPLSSLIHDNLRNFTVVNREFLPPLDILFYVSPTYSNPTHP